MESTMSGTERFFAYLLPVGVMLVWLVVLRLVLRSKDRNRWHAPLLVFSGVVFIAVLMPSMVISLTWGGTWGYALGGLLVFIVLLIAIGFFGYAAEVIAKHRKGIQTFSDESPPRKA